MQPLTIDTLEDQLATILLSIARHTTPPSHAIKLAYRHTASLFLQTHAQNTYVPQPSLLEGLLRISAIDTSLLYHALTCILVLSACSVRAWKITFDTDLVTKFPEIRHVVLAAISMEDKYGLQMANTSVREALSSALMNLSDVNCHAQSTWLATYPTTPLFISLPFCSAAVLKNGQNQDASQGSGRYYEDMFRGVLQRMSNVHWEGFDVETLEVIQRAGMHLGVSGTEMAKVDRAIEVQGGMWRIERRNAELKLEDVQTMEEAYWAVRRYVDSGREEQVVSAGKKWLKENSVEIFAGGYVGGPKVLQSVADSYAKEKVWKAVVAVRCELRSEGVDEVIEEGLADLLYGIRELRGIVGRRDGEDYVQIPKKAEGKLKKVSLIYPHLIVRRRTWFCSTGMVILEGLEDEGQRYESGALKALEVIVSVFGVVTAVLEGAEVDEFLMGCIEFVVGEKRLENGMPRMLWTLTVSLLKAIGKHRTKTGRARLMEVLDKLVLNTGKNDEGGIREGAEELMRKARMW